MEATLKAMDRVGCVAKESHGTMRKKRKKLDKGKEARRRARTAGVPPAGTRVIADKRKKPEKHRKAWIVEAEVPG